MSVRLSPPKPMSADARAELAVADALRLRSQLPETFDGKCQGPVCGNAMRKPRYLKSERGSRYVTWSFCSQECHDAYLAQFRGAPPHWEKFDRDGVPIGFIVQGRGFVSLDQIDQDSSTEREELHGE